MQDNTRLLTLSNPSSFFLIGNDPRQPIRVPIAEATYHDPKVSLYFFRDPYLLQIKDTVYQQSPGDDNGGSDPELPGSGDGGGDDQGGEGPTDSEDGDQEDDDEDDEAGDNEPGDEGIDDDGDDGDDDDSGDDDIGDQSGDGNDDGDDNEDSADDDQHTDNDDEGDDDDDDDDEGDDDDDDEGDDDDEDDDDDEGDDDDDQDDDDDDDGRLKASRGKTVNLSDFISNAKPSLLLLGTYQKGDSVIQVIVALDLEPTQLSPTPAAPMIVRTSDMLFATATVQPGKWFEAVPSADLNKCALISFRGQTVLLIHKDFNSSIHEILIRQVQPSADVQFRVEKGL